MDGWQAPIPSQSLGRRASCFPGLTLTAGSRPTASNRNSTLFLDTRVVGKEQLRLRFHVCQVGERFCWRTREDGDVAAHAAGSCKVAATCKSQAFMTLVSGIDMHGPPLTRLSWQDPGVVVVIVIRRRCALCCSILTYEVQYLCTSYTIPIKVLPRLPPLLPLASPRIVLSLSAPLLTYFAIPRLLSASLVRLAVLVVEAASSSQSASKSLSQSHSRRQSLSSPPLPAPRLQDPPTTAPTDGAQLRSGHKQVR